jgi:hypothetical protein
MCGLVHFLSILAVISVAAAASAQGNTTTTAGISAAAFNASISTLMAAVGEGTTGFVGALGNVSSGTSDVVCTLSAPLSTRKHLYRNNAGIVYYHYLYTHFSSLSNFVRDPNHQRHVHSRIYACHNLRLLAHCGNRQQTKNVIVGKGFVDSKQSCLSRW